MRLLRLLLAWLLLAALPLQGVAAATMALCGTAGAAAEPALHEHAHHGATHGHQAAASQQAADDSPAAAHHACSICATCCNAAALPAAVPASPVVAVGHPFAPGPAGPLVEQPSTVIERPPRA